MFDVKLKNCHRDPPVRCRQFWSKIKSQVNTGTGTGGHLTTGGGREGAGGWPGYDATVSSTVLKLGSTPSLGIFHQTREINCLFSDRGRVCTLGHSISYVSFVAQQCHSKYVGGRATSDRLFIISSHLNMSTTI